MKILLVTGRKAADEVARCIQGTERDVSVYVSGCDVAALLDINDLAEDLSAMDLSIYSVILLPGAVRGDASFIEEKTGIKCLKGPRNLADLRPVLEKVMKNEVKLSPTDPADVVLQKEMRNDVKKELGAVYGKPQRCAMKVGKEKLVYLGTGVSHIIAEINDVSLLTEKELIEKAQHYVSSGAELIDLGMAAGMDNSSKIAGIIKILRSVVDVPLSIDSLSKNEILAAAEAGIDLVISIDETNSGAIPCLGVPFVLIPRDEKGVVPEKAEERIRIIESLMERSKGRDFLVDLILNPPNHGLTESLKAYALFRERHPGTPLFMGAGNVSELLDADSVGVNALLMAIASELSVDLVLSTEASQKTQGSIRELRTAAEMLYIAKSRKQAPKDLGIDLLILKDKKKKAFPVKDAGIEKIRVLDDREVALEDCEFEIYLADGINVVCYKKKKPIMHLFGDSADKLYKEVLGRGMTKDAVHAAYLGKELAKAEIALKLGKNYVQDEPLF